jgi:hypothetical protein
VSASNRDTGRIGEFFAAYVLEKHGVECHHVDREGSDLWCKVRESIVTVEVKTATRIRAGGGGPAVRVPRYNYNTRPTSDADWYCFVALDEELMLMRPSSVVVTKHTAISPECFTLEAQEQSIEEFLRSC